MKMNSLKTTINSFWEFEKAGDSICGKFIDVAKKVGENDVILLKTPEGIHGVNVYASIKRQAEDLKKGSFYIFTFAGVAKGKESGRDYFKIEVIQPEPESEEDKKLLNSWYEKVTFNRPVQDEEESSNDQVDTSGIDDDLPF